MDASEGYLLLLITYVDHVSHFGLCLYFIDAKEAGWSNWVVRVSNLVVNKQMTLNLKNSFTYLQFHLVKRHLILRLAYLKIA
jgi:hypothetical protein